MKVFERVARLLRADAHGVMDQLEERSLLLKQHLREAEVEVAHKRARLEALDEEQQRAVDDAQRLEATLRGLDEDVELALSGDDPELARFAVRRLLPRRDGLIELRARVQRLSEGRARLAALLDEQEAQLAELRPRVSAELARRPPADGGPAAPFAEIVVSDEEVELELLRRHAAAPSGEAAR